MDLVNHEFRFGQAPNGFLGGKGKNGFESSVVSTLLSKEILGYVNVSASKKVFSLMEEESSRKAPCGQGRGLTLYSVYRGHQMFVD